MDFEPESRGESLIPSAQEKTALRTHQLLVASRLVFVFSHGVLLVLGSWHLSARGGSRSGQSAPGAETSWWLVFLPVWLGDTICLCMVILSWFASCPYIRLCMAERQARLGETNPSILTELLPEIVMAVLGLIFMVMALTAEILLCRYFDLQQRGQDGTLVPSAVLFIVLALLACCRGVCIRTNGEMFLLLGAGMLATTVVALRVPGGLFGASSWVLVLPALFSSAGFLLVAFARLRGFWEVFNRQERFLRIVEQAFAFVVLLSLGALALSLAKASSDRTAVAAPATAFGSAVGFALCAIAVLRVQMAIAESRSTLVRDRITAWSALRMNNQSARTIVAPTQQAMRTLEEGLPVATAHHEAQGVGAGAEEGPAGSRLQEQADERDRAQGGAPL